MPDGKPETVQDFRAEYAALRGKQKAFTREIDAVIRRVISAKNIDVVNIECRTKSVKSFVEKCEREDKDYFDPLTQMTDLTGCRVICYYTSDIEKVASVLEANFTIDKDNSVDKLVSDSPDQFGYQSKHLVVSFSPERLRLDDFKEFSGMKAEIQVRTSLQHSWAAIEHKLQYKNAEHIPAPLKRKLFRIAALLELADEEFNYLEKNIGHVRKEIEENIESGDLSVSVDAESVDLFLISSGVIHEAKGYCEKIGFSIAPPHPSARRPIGKLVDTLITAEIESVDKLQSQIFKIQPRTEWNTIFSELYTEWKKSMGYQKPVIDLFTITRIMVCMSVNEKIFRKILREVPFGPKIQSALIETRKSYHN